MASQFIESFVVFGFWIGYYWIFLAFLKRHMQSVNSKQRMLRDSGVDVGVVRDKGLDKNDLLASTDSSATITQRTRRFQKVDLFCPHPFLLAQQAKLATTPKPVEQAISASPDTLLSTTAFPRAVVHPVPRPAPRLRVAVIPRTAPSREFVTEIRRLLDLIQDMRREELAPLAMSFIPVLVEIGRNLNHLRLNGRHMVTLGILARIIMSQVPRDLRSEPAFTQDGLRALIGRIENLRRPSATLSAPTATLSPTFSNADTSPSVTTPSNSPAFPNTETSRAPAPLNTSTNSANAQQTSDRRSWRHSISQRLRLPYMR
ncbi:hypothetical protein FRC08_013965 [Ceratobasidium sp. 394]|nr:hypothetical protein FRC08_013965 [Ceratobasidium sp. 394]